MHLPGYKARSPLQTTISQKKSTLMQGSPSGKVEVINYPVGSMLGKDLRKVRHAPTQHVQKQVMTPGAQKRTLTVTVPFSGPDERLRAFLAHADHLVEA